MGGRLTPRGAGLPCPAKGRHGVCHEVGLGSATRARRRRKGWVCDAHLDVRFIRRGVPALSVQVPPDHYDPPRWSAFSGNEKTPGVGVWVVLGAVVLGLRTFTARCAPFGLSSPDLARSSDTGIIPNKRSVRQLPADDHSADDRAACRSSCCVRLAVGDVDRAKHTGGSAVDRWLRRAGDSHNGVGLWDGQREGECGRDQ